MAVHMGEVSRLRARQGQQAMINTHEILADNIQATARQEAVDIRNPASNGIFNRQHSQGDVAIA